MAIGVNSVLNMGVGALFASQAAINTTGNNISNVNTPGYSRQAVVLQEQMSIDYNPGQVGQGVLAKEIIRYFDSFVEKAYLEKLGTSSRYQAEYGLMRTAETVFNESNVNGISSALTEMLKSWNTLAQEPDSQPAREALLAKATTLASAVRNADDTLRSLQEQTNSMIAKDVDKANTLIKDIAALNKEIAAHYLEGRNNPNSLMDERDRKTRELGAIIDVNVIDRGAGDYIVTTKSGNMLVQEGIPYSLDFRGPSVENNLTPTSPFKGTNATGAPKTAYFSGSDSHEYTVEMVNGSAIGGGAQFKVSIDGGKSWLTDDAGNVRLFNANEENQSVRVGDIDIWFDAGNVAAGDRFVISPKSDVYWVRPTSGPLNISTQVYADGTDNSLRLTGGSLAGYIEFRDYMVGEYRDRLEAFSDSVTWEVNRIHSQGAGLTPMTNVLGTTQVGRPTAALGSPEALFSWSDRLQSGNMTFEIYDATTGNSLIPYPGLDVFSPTNFDPAVHSLNDVAAAINAGPANAYLTATVIDGRLQLSSQDPTRFTFAVTADTTGLAAALGMNTFFKGETPGTFGVRDELTSNSNLINAGRVNGAGEMNPGDNITAKEIAALATKRVNIGTVWQASTYQSITDYYATLVAKVGADTASIKYTSATETTMAQDLYDRQEEISGVNLDEEMSNLIRFQASYKAAAKLITTADEMLQTLLSLKQ